MRGRLDGGLIKLSGLLDTFHVGRDDVSASEKGLLALEHLVRLRG